MNQNLVIPNAPLNITEEDGSPISPKFAQMGQLFIDQIQPITEPISGNITN